MMPARLVWLEVCRLARSRRWLLVGIVALFVAALASGDVAAESSNTGLRPTAVDVHATAIDNLMYVGYLAFVSFAYLAGGTPLASGDEGQIAPVRSRGVAQRVWWFATVLALALGAFCTQILLLGSCVLLGAAWRGWSVTGVASRFATAPTFRHGALFFPPVAETTDMLARQLGLVGYLALVFWALGVAVVAVSIRWPSVPAAAVALLGLMADYVIVKAWAPLRVMSVGARMLEGAHHFGPEPLDWRASVALYVALLTRGGGRRCARTRQARGVAGAGRELWVEVCQSRWMREAACARQREQRARNGGLRPDARRTTGATWKKAPPVRAPSLRRLRSCQRPSGCPCSSSATALR